MIIKELLTVIGLDFDDKAVKNTKIGIEGLTETVRALGAAFLANEVVTGIANFVQNIAHASRELDLNSQRLGVTTRQMQIFGLVAADSGRDVEDVVDAVSTLQERMRDAVQDPRSDPAVQLRALGLAIPRSVRDMPDAITLFRQAADGLRNMENQTDRVGAAMTVFGDVGRELLPVLQQGSGVIDRYAAELERLGGGISDEVIQSSRELLAQQARLDIAWTSLKSLIGAEILPRLADMAMRSVEIASGFLEIARETNIVKAGLIVLAGVLGALASAMIAAYAGPLAAFALVAAAIALITLLVDDLITLFEGGDSAIGRFIDSMFGVGTSQQWVRDLTDAWNGLTLAIRRAWAALKGEEFDDNIANEVLTPAEARRRQREAAAREGRIVADRGQSFEEALAATNRIRSELGLDPITVDDEGNIHVPSSESEPARGRQSRRRSQRRTLVATAVQGEESITGVRQATAVAPRAAVARAFTQNNNTTIRIDGNADERTVRQIEQVITRVMNQRNREAIDALDEESED